MPGDEPRELPALSVRIRIPEDVLMRQVGDELVLLNLRDESYYGLNAVGVRLMQLAETGTTLEDAANTLITEFEVGREQLDADIRRLAAELLSAGLLERAAPP